MESNHAFDNLHHEPAFRQLLPTLVCHPSVIALG